METERSPIKDGKTYDHLFPKASLTEVTIKKGATVEDTVHFIPKAVQMTRWQVRRFVKQELEGLDAYSACRKLWYFLYEHVGYKKDDAGMEQIKSPRYVWHTRFQGCDCDDFTTSVGTCLSWLKGISHVLLRITKYKKDYFQHIYPVAVLSNGRHVTLDCVANRFDYEVPYSQKKDTIMDLQFLDGLDDSWELGKPAKKGIFKRKPAATSPAPKKKILTKVKEAVKKGVHAVNRINPATVLLRNGVLAAMKLNTMNVAGRLRWAYMTDQQAVQKKADPAKLARLREVRKRLENIFHGAGGKPENLKKAILEGKGNKDKAVPLSGLGYYPIDDLSGLNPYMPLAQLLGKDIYYAENIEGMEGFSGFGDLGEPASASVAAATGALATLAAILKSIGSIFPKGDKASQDFNKGDSEAESTAPSIIPLVNDTTPINIQVPIIPSANLVVNPAPIPAEATISPAEENAPTPEAEPEADGPANSLVIRSDSSPIVAADSALPAVIPPTVTIPQTTIPPKSQANFWEKNKSWLVPALWGIGGISLIYLGYLALKPKKKTTRQASVQGTGTLTGLTSRRKTTKNQKRKKPGPKPKTKGRPRSKKGSTKLRKSALPLM